MARARADRRPSLALVSALFSLARVASLPRDLAGSHALGLPPRWLGAAGLRRRAGDAGGGASCSRSRDALLRLRGGSYESDLYEDEWSSESYVNGDQYDYARPPIDQPKQDSPIDLSGLGGFVRAPRPTRRSTGAGRGGPETAAAAPSSGRTFLARARVRPKPRALPEARRPALPRRCPTGRRV